MFIINPVQIEKQTYNYNTVRKVLEGQDSVCGGGISNSDCKGWR